MRLGLRKTDRIPTLPTDFYNLRALNIYMWLSNFVLYKSYVPFSVALGQNNIEHAKETVIKEIIDSYQQRNHIYCNFTCKRTQTTQKLVCWKQFIGQRWREGFRLHVWINITSQTELGTLQHMTVFDTLYTVIFDMVSEQSLKDIYQILITYLYLLTTRSDK